MVQTNSPGISGLAGKERLLEVARNYTLLNDVFMKYALDDIAACQHVIRIITGKYDLIVKHVRSQYHISELTSHDAVLDILAEDSEGRLYNLEIQRANTVDHARRCRFCSAMVDTRFLPKGTSYAEMPDVYIIYISESDIWRGGKTTYKVIKALGQPSVPYNDGQHIIYVNAAVDDGSATAALMQYFKTSDPDDMSQGDLSARVHLIKREKGGREILCKVTDEIYQYGFKAGEAKGEARGEARGKAQGEAIGILLVARNMKRMAAFSDEDIARATNLPLEQVKALKIN